jgi:hypothetical protein
MPLLRRWRSRKPNRSSAPIPACSRGMRTLLAMCSSSDVGSGECACRVSVGRSSRSLGGKAILPLCVSEIGMRFMKCMGIFVSKTKLLCETYAVLVFTSVSVVWPSPWPCARSTPRRKVGPITWRCDWTAATNDMGAAWRSRARTLVSSRDDPTVFIFTTDVYPSVSR